MIILAIFASDCAWAKLSPQSLWIISPAEAHTSVFRTPLEYMNMNIQVPRLLLFSKRISCTNDTPQGEGNTVCVSYSCYCHLVMVHLCSRYTSRIVQCKKWKVHLLLLQDYCRTPFFNNKFRFALHRSVCYFGGYRNSRSLNYHFINTVPESKLRSIFLFHSKVYLLSMKILQ